MTRSDSIWSVYFLHLPEGLLRIQLCLFVYSQWLPLCSLYKMILQAHVIFFLLQIPELITKQISLTLLGWN